MVMTMRTISLWLCLCWFPVMMQGNADFSHYAIILERQPFGAPAEEPVAPPVSQEPPPFVQELRLVAMTESPAGLRIGFMNTRKKPPRTYFLYVGESEDGILLADADYDGARALVSKDGQEYWLRIGEGSEAAASAPASAATPAERANRTGAIRAGAGAAANPADTRDSYAARRQQRQQRLEEIRARAEASRQLSEEEVERQLREYQMRLIREGRTPLPIPITEEMDRQLVQEGILPPVE